MLTCCGRPRNAHGGNVLEKGQILAVVLRSILILVMLWPTIAPAQNLEAGRAAFKARDHDTALRELMPLAEGGNAEAQHMIGILYVRGRGVKRSRAEGTRWFQMAAEQGYGPAQHSMGVMSMAGDDRDFKEAVRWFRSAAEQGVVRSQVQLGVMLRTGLGVDTSYFALEFINFVEAEKWFRLAAEAGDMEGQFHLGNIYYDNKYIDDENFEVKGIQKDYAEALRWFRLAARQSSGLAFDRLARMHFDGHGVPKDNVKALIYYEVARYNQPDHNYRGVIAMVEREMTPMQVAEGRRRAEVCIASEFQDCE